MKRKKKREKAPRKQEKRKEMEWNGHFMGPSGLDLRDCSVVWWWWWRAPPN